VVRNRLRRLIREIFRTHQAELRPDVDMVLVMRAGAARLTYQELEARFLNGARRSGALKSASGPGEQKSGE
jgi:ribonuclease P protein component